MCHAAEIDGHRKQTLVVGHVNHNNSKALPGFFVESFNWSNSCHRYSNLVLVGWLLWKLFAFLNK
jgi:hypothetical protein